MTKHQLQLRSATELSTERFFVPAYQRGYRWTSQQVNELLNDVWDFVQGGGRNQGQFYCLQPVVVFLRDGGDWEVVDGQQRLTTLYLILHRFNRRLQDEDQNALYSIEYETRPASAQFLRHLAPERAQENIDFFHMAEAFTAIDKWVLEHKSRTNDMESAFLNDVKVIWYEIGDTNPIEVFQRLNIGKIPLTGAELVKALLLRGSNFNKDGDRALQLQQLQIAHEWDAIERRLGESDFWYFLTNRAQESNRIEFILQLYCAQLPSDDAEWTDDSVFHGFAKHMATRSHAWPVWEDVKGLFQTVEEWHRDPTLYHLIGFLATVDQTSTPHRAIALVNKLAADADTKRNFREALRSQIFRRVFMVGRERAPDRGEKLRHFIANELEDLDYDSNKVRIRDVLLLFNITSIMASRTSARFPFESYKLEDWDIEHIRSVHSRMPQSPPDQKAWLANLLTYLGDAAARQSPESPSVNDESSVFDPTAKHLLQAENHDSAAFAEFFVSVQARYHPHQDPEVDNSLGNLTLLDRSTNRGYGNAIFPIKRKTIVERDREGRFIPLCTRNVFLKYYSARVDRMLDWTSEDAEAYLAAIITSLTSFFAREEAV
jgi:hypothetical protein